MLIHAANKAGTAINTCSVPVQVLRKRAENSFCCCLLQALQQETWYIEMRLNVVSLRVNATLNHQHGRQFCTFNNKELQQTGTAQFTMIYSLIGELHMFNCLKTWKQQAPHNHADYKSNGPKHLHSLQGLIKCVSVWSILYNNTAQAMNHWCPG